MNLSDPNAHQSNSGVNFFAWARNAPSNNPAAFVIGGINAAFQTQGVDLQAVKTEDVIVGGADVTRQAFNVLVLDVDLLADPNVDWRLKGVEIAAGIIGIAPGAGDAAQGIIKTAVRTIGGRLPINSKYAGGVHPSGVQFTEAGFPDLGRTPKLKCR